MEYFIVTCVIIILVWFGVDCHVQKRFFTDKVEWTMYAFFSGFVVLAFLGY
jgi:hypothetical protein